MAIIEYPEFYYQCDGCKSKPVHNVTTICAPDTSCNEIQLCNKCYDEYLKGVWGLLRKLGVNRDFEGRSEYMKHRNEKPF